MKLPLYQIAIIPNCHYTKLVLYQIGIIPNCFIPNHVIPNHVLEIYTNSRYSKSRYTKSLSTKKRSTVKSSPFWWYSFPQQKLCISCGKKWYGLLHFGRFFHKLIWCLWQQQDCQIFLDTIFSNREKIY
jgi:hypothetical protein